jgi:hypothetical protein
VEQQVAAQEKTYRLSRAGRRVAYLLLGGSVLIWLFALWTLKNTLKIGLRPENIGPTLKLLVKRILGFAGTEPLTAEEAIPALIMFVLVLIVPLLIWNIIEELRASYTIGPAGITFQSWGIRLQYPWTEVAEVRPVDEETEEPLHELIVRQSRLSTIRSGLARFLHWQAHGRNKLPLYSGLEERDDMLARIRNYMATVAAATAAAEEAAAAAAEVDQLEKSALPAAAPSATVEAPPAAADPAGVEPPPAGEAAAPPPAVAGSETSEE